MIIGLFKNPANFYLIHKQDLIQKVRKKIMTETEKRAHKLRLYEKCKNIIEDRIAAIRMAMNDAQASANSEEKSSAGDKYETSRAMSHLEKDMHAKQLSASMKEIESLLSVDCNQLYIAAQKGSFVTCEKISFFIAAGLGKITFENEIIFLVSPAAPVSKILSGKRARDTIIFNKEEYIIRDVY